MANVLIYNTTNNRPIRYLTSVDTPLYSSRDDVLINPDLSPVTGIDWRYWIVDAGAVREMTQQEKDDLAALEAAAAADMAAANLAQLKQDALNYYNADQDALQRSLRAAMWTIIELTVGQLNILRAQHGLAALTDAQVKTAFTNSYQAKIEAIE